MDSDVADRSVQLTIKTDADLEAMKKFTGLSLSSKLRQAPLLLESVHCMRIIGYISKCYLEWPH